MRTAAALVLILALSGCALTAAQVALIGAGAAAGVSLAVFGMDFRADAACADQDARAVRAGKDPLQTPCPAAGKAP